MTTSPIRLGISRCLLGDEVRFDGGHKRDHFLTAILGHYVEWVPVCPEVEAGLGTPREAMRLVGNPRHPRLMTITSARDHTAAMETMIEERLESLDKLDLSGFVFKKGSPSCGLERVRVYTEQGMPSHSGSGIFARAFRNQYPLIPLEEEGRLGDPSLRENFIERVFSYHRFQDLVRTGITSHALIRFHTIHKYLLLAHSKQHYAAMGRLVGQAKRYRARELALKYGELFMHALAMKATVRKHVNVLQHIVGYLKNRLGTHEKAELLGVIDDYHKGLTPLVVPLTLVKHYVRIFDVGYMRDQVYLNPHPKELMLRNHV
ncbi:YbgA family protein [Nitrospira sp. BLG_2]|uniref:YbgA family protein n=1 Tax=Nitrospira sp. BLG_2 TaxID=3397507 RepID=UPI003B992BA2